MSLAHYLKKIFQSSLGSVAGILTSLIRNKILAELLGASAIGVLGQLNRMTILANNLYSLGMNTTVVARVAEARGEGDAGTELRVQLAFLLPLFWLSLVLMLVCQVFPASLSIYFFNTAEYGLYIQMVGWSFVFASLQLYYGLQLSAYKYLSRFVQANVSGNFLMVGATIVLIYQYGLAGGVLSFTVGSAIGMLINGGMAYYVGIPLNLRHLFSWNRVSGKLFVQMLLFGLIGVISSLAIHNAMAIVIKWSRNWGPLENNPDGNMGLLQSALNISQQYLQLFFSGIQLYFLPHLAGLQGNKAIGEEINRIFRTLLLLLTPSLLLLLAASDWVFLLIYTEEFLYAAELLRVSLFMFFFRLTISLFNSFILIRRKLLLWLFTDLTYAAGFFGGSWLLYPHLGLFAPIVMMLTMNGVLLGMYLVLFKRLFDFSLSWKNFLLLGGSMGLLGLLYGLYPWLPNWALLLAALAMSGLLVVLVVTRAEYRDFVQTVRRKLFP